VLRPEGAGLVLSLPGMLLGLPLTGPNVAFESSHPVGLACACQLCTSGAAWLGLLHKVLVGQHQRSTSTYALQQAVIVLLACSTV